METGLSWESAGASGGISIVALVFVNTTEYSSSRSSSGKGNSIKSRL